MSSGSRRFTVFALATLVGGALTAAGCFMAWWRLPSGVIGFVGGRVAAEGSGIDSVYGLVALGAAALAVAGGGIWLVRRAAGWLPSSLAALGGVSAAGVGMYYLLTLDERFVDAAIDQAASDELPAGKIARILRAFIRAGTVDPQPDLGLWLVIGGGALALVIGGIGLFRSWARSPVR